VLFKGEKGGDWKPEKANQRLPRAQNCLSDQLRWLLRLPPSTLYAYACVPPPASRIYHLYRGKMVFLPSCNYCQSRKASKPLQESQNYFLNQANLDVHSELSICRSSWSSVTMTVSWWCIGAYDIGGSDSQGWITDVDSYSSHLKLDMERKVASPWQMFNVLVSKLHK